MTQLAGYDGAFYVASGSNVSISDEALTDTGDHQTYVISNAAHRFWDDTVTPVIEVSTNSGSTWSTSVASKTFQYVGGRVIFAVGNPSANLYRVHTGAYFPITQIGGGHEWSMNTDADLYDATEFGQAWKVYVAGSRSATASVNRWWLDSAFFTFLVNGSRIVLALYTSATNGSRYEGFALVKQNQVKTPADGLVDTAISFQVDDNFYFNPGP